MTQEAVQLTETPPLPGLQMAQSINKALETLATDFSGDTDPANKAWPYSTWADTGTGTFKRRNAANSAWVIEGRLLRGHLPMYAQADVPTLDIGPIYIIGKGPAEWKVSAYDPLIKGIPGATFAEIDALSSDQGSIICTDRDGILYKWDSGTSKYVAQTADNPTALARASSTTIMTPAALGFAEQPVKTGSAQFVRATNEILMNGIVTELGLEIGDVIQITGTASNNLIMTVEVITDANDINVNYAHRNGAGSLSLTNETAANATIKRIAKWYNATLGLGQAWVNVASSRSINTAYQNTTRRLIVVSMTTASSGASFSVSNDGSTWMVAATQGAERSPFSIPIPDGWYGKCNNGGSIANWLELR